MAAGAGCSRSFVSPNQGNREALTATAVPSVVAPQGISQLHIGGGDGTYHLDLAPSNTRSGAGAHVDEHSLEYVAGDTGNVTDLVTVTDEAGDSVDVAIAVGPNLALTPQQLVRAPLQSWSFQVSGGQPQYCYTVDTQGSACPGVSTPVCGDAGMTCGSGDAGLRGSCIDGSGNYLARSCGGGLDVVHVKDANGATFEAEVAISTALAISPSLTAAVPGQPFLFQAVGGVPPYHFEYQARGNESEGALGGVGNYQAGPNPVTVDRIRVVDAVNAVAEAEIDVGSAQLALPPGHAYRLYSGDFNGDGFDDVVALSPDLGVLVLGSSTGFLKSTSFSFSVSPGSLGSMPYHLSVAVADFNRDGTSDVLLMSEVQAQTLLGRRDGSFDVLAPQQLFDTTAVSVGDTVIPFTFSDGDTGALLPVEDLDTGERSLQGVELQGLAWADAGLFPAPSSQSLSDVDVVLSRERLGASPFVEVHGEQNAGTSCAAAAGAALYPLVTYTDDGGLVDSDEALACIPGSGVVVGDGLQTTPSYPGPPTFVATDPSTASGLQGLAWAAPSGSYALLPLPDALFRNQFVPVEPVVLGTDFTDQYLAPEFEVLGDQRTDRVQVLEDGGLFSRPDGLPGRLSGTVSLDLDSDHCRDLVTVDRGGMMTFLRGSPGGYLGRGGGFLVQGPGEDLIAGDVDGDGRDDVLAANPSVQVLWGTPEGSLALGPTLENRDVVINAMAAGEGSAWVTVPAGDAGVVLDHFSLVEDGGFARDAQPLGSLDDRFQTPMEVVSSDTVLVRGYRNHDFGGHIDAVRWRGGSFEVANLNAQLTGYASFRAVVSMAATGASAHDLVVWESDGLTQNQLGVHPAAADGSLSWSADATRALDLSGIAGVDGWVTALFRFASHPGGSIDRLLAVMAPDDGSGFCDDSGGVTLVLLAPDGQGGLKILDQSPYDVLQYGCEAYTWTFGSGDTNGQGLVDVLVGDSNNTVRFSNGANSLQSWSFVDVSGAHQESLFFADVDGDGHPDMVYSLTDRPLVQVLRNDHGSFH